MRCARTVIKLSIVAACVCAGAASAQPNAAERGDRSALPLGAPISGDGDRGVVAGDTAREGSGAVGEVVRTVWPLALVVGLIGLVAWGGRSYAKSRGGLMLSMSAGGRAPAGILTVLGRYPIGRGQTLVLLRCDARVLLLHQTGGAKGGMTAITEFVDPDEVASLVRKADAADGSGPGARFASMLGAARGSLETKPVRSDGGERDVGFGARTGGDDASGAYRRVISGEGGDRAELLGAEMNDENADGIELGGVEDLATRIEALRRADGSGAGVRA